MRDQAENGGPAFAHGNPEQGGDPGMSLRDWFAGQALVGLLSGYWGNPEMSGLDPAMLADEAYRQASAMLDRRMDSAEDQRPNAEPTPC